jgi:hypothetical protein
VLGLKRILPEWHFKYLAIFMQMKNAVAACTLFMSTAIALFLPAFLI